MSKYFLLIGLLCLLFAFQEIANVSGQSADNKTVKKQSNPKYKIIKSKCVRDTFLLVVVIKSEYLNREDMIALAETIKSDFPKENQIEVVFFINKKAAKSKFLIDRDSPNYEKYKEALRASYQLDRTVGKELLTFAPIGRKAFDREEIDLSKNN